MSNLEARVRRLERLVIGLAAALVVCAAWAVAGSAATAQPKPPDAEFSSVKAAEVLTPAVDVEQLTATRSVLLEDKKGKGSVALVVRPADAGPGLLIKSPAFSFTVTDGGILHESRTSKASFGVVFDAKEQRYRLVTKDAKGNVEINLP